MRPADVKLLSLTVSGLREEFKKLKIRPRGCKCARCLKSSRGGAMKVEIHKREYSRKRAQFSVWVTYKANGAEGVASFCALPLTDEPLARVVAAAMERLVETADGRALVQAADDEMMGCV
jgi:hypothetical protein